MGRNPDSGGGEPGLRWGSVLLVVGVLIASAWLVQRVELVYGGAGLTDGVFPAIPAGLLALLAILGRWMGRGERAVVYVALATGLPLAASGLMHRFLPGLVTGFYGGFAGPTDRYTRFLSQMPSWMAPGGPHSAAAVGAFEGGGAVPWEAWALPLMAWSIFFLALFLTSFCLVGILRRRWLETERLGFPLLVLPLGLLSADGPSLYRSRAFWWGVAVPAALLGVNGLHHYFPAVGEIETRLNLGDFLLETPWRSMAPFTSPFLFEFSPALLGIAYLMPVEVSFSTWFFFLVTRLQLLLTYVVGLSEARGSFVGLGSEWLDWPNRFPFFMSQARGGLLFLALFSLWSARGALKAAFSRRGRLVYGLLAGFGILWAWTVAAGLSPILGFLALLIFFLLSISFARLRVDGGLPVTGVPVLVGYLFFLFLGTGPGVFEDRTYVVFAFLGVLAYTSLGIWPAVQLEGLKLAEVCRVDLRRMVGGMGLGLAVGLAAGCFFSLETIYAHGIFALDQQGGARTAARIGRYYHYLYEHVGSRQGAPDWDRLGFHALGMGVTWLLIVMRRRFLRWPLHPIGYIYGTGFGWPVWGAAFVGWFCKWLVSHYGGATTYRKVRPLFLGMIFGEVGMRLLWAGVSVWQGEMGAGFRP